MCRRNLVVWTVVCHLWRLFVTFLVRLSSGVDDGLPLRHAFRHVLEQNFGQLTHLFSSLVQSFASCNEVLPVRIIESQSQSESTRVSPSQFVSVSQCSSVPFFWCPDMSITQASRKQAITRVNACPSVLLFSAL